MASKASFIVILLWVLPHNYLNSANAHETSEACISHKVQSLNNAGGSALMAVSTIISCSYAFIHAAHYTHYSAAVNEK